MGFRGESPMADPLILFLIFFFTSHFSLLFLSSNVL